MGPSTVFISHASRDQTVAGLVCQALEQRHIRCWIAPRDIGVGEIWDEAIANGIKSCQVVVLIFSSGTNDSAHVKREIHLAFDKAKLVIPFRVEGVKPDGGLEYMMVGVQWLDAVVPPLEHHLKVLVDRVEAIIGAAEERPAVAESRSHTQQAPAGQTAQPEPEPAPPRATRKFPRWVWGALATLALVTVFAAVRRFMPQPHPEPTPVSTSQPQPTSTPVPFPQPQPTLQPKPTPQPKPLVSRPDKVLVLEPSNPKRVVPQEKKPVQVENSRPSVQMSGDVRGQKPAPVEGSKPSVPNPSVFAIGRQATALYGQQRYGEAAPLYDQGCNAGDPKACAMLGVMYYFGQGVTRDYSHSVALDSKACDGGYALGCALVGQAYREGRGVEKDAEKGRQLIGEACRMGAQRACDMLADATPPNSGDLDSSSRSVIPPPAPTPAPSKFDERTLRLTRTNPSATRMATITAPGNGLQNHNIFHIDTRDFAEGGTLVIDIGISRSSATDGSFDLFPDNVPIPLQGDPTGTLIGSYNVPRGSSTRLEYRFGRGQVFALNLEGNWFSPKGATGPVQFRATVRK